MNRLSRFGHDGWKFAGALMAGWLALARPSPAQTAPAAEKPIFLSHKAASKLLLEQVKPEYPPLARINFIQGQVRIQVVVTREGKVRQAHVIHGHPFLAAAALKAVRRWLYAPYKTARGETEFATVVDMNFSLRIKKLEFLPPHPVEDLSRQVRPPEIIQKPSAAAPAHSVRLRVLVGDEGKPLDIEPVRGVTPQFDAAWKHIERCKFHPAHLGALPVPWYLDVDVPVEDYVPPQGDPGGR